MRKFDKTKGINKANILAEQRYLVKKGLIKENNNIESKGDIRLAIEMSNNLIQNGVSQFDNYDIDCEDIKLWIPDENIGNGDDLYIMEFDISYKQTSRGYYTPSKTSGHPDSWYPEEGADSEYGFKLISVKIYVENELKYEGLNEFLSSFKKIEESIYEQIEQKVDERYIDCNEPDGEPSGNYY